jgi:GTP-binding protein HflX
VYNKIDRLGTSPRLERDEESSAAAVWCSAARGDGLDLLKQAIAERLSRAACAARLRIPPAAGALRSQLYSRGAVREERTLEDGTIDLTVELPETELEALARGQDGVQVLRPRVPAKAGSADPASDEAPCAVDEAYLQSIV